MKSKTSEHQTKKIGLAVLEFLPTHSAALRSVTSKLFLFYFINNFLIVTVSGTIFTALESIIQNPSLIPELLANSLPGVSISYLFLLSRLPF